MDKIKSVTSWLAKRKIVVIMVSALVVITAGFFVFLRPNLRVTNIYMGISELDVREAVYTPEREYFLMWPGDEAGYLLDALPSSSFLFTECEYDEEVVKLDGSYIIAKQEGTTDITCKGKLKKGVSATITVVVRQQ